MKRNKVSKPICGHSTNALEATKPNIDSVYLEILKMKEDTDQQVNMLETHYKSKLETFK